MTVSTVSRDWGHNWSLVPVTLVVDYAESGGGIEPQVSPRARGRDFLSLYKPRVYLKTGQLDLDAMGKIKDESLIEDWQTALFTA